MAKFTRGPWKRSELFCGLLFVTSNEGVIAEVRPIEDGVGEANVRLIEAAPELYDAGIAVRAVLETFLGSGECSLKDVHAVHDALVIALAKAAS